MASETQYRVNKSGANLRDEPAPKARIVTLFRPGTIVYVDHAVGDWHYVEVRGWMHKSTLTALEAIK